MSTYGRKRRAVNSREQKSAPTLSPSKHSQHAQRAATDNQIAFDSPIISTDLPNINDLSPELPASRPRTRRSLRLQSPQLDGSSETPDSPNTSSQSIFSFVDDPVQPANKDPSAAKRQRPGRASAPTKASESAKNSISNTSMTVNTKNDHSPVRKGSVTTIRSPKKKSPRKVYIPKVTNIEDEFFVEPPRDLKPKWTGSEKQTVSPPSSPTPRLRKVAFIDTTETEEIESSPFGSLFEDLDSVVTTKKTTLSLKNVTKKSVSKEPVNEIGVQINRSLTELQNLTPKVSEESSPKKQPEEQDEPKITSTNGRAKRLYGMVRSFRDGGGERLSEDEEASENDMDMDDLDKNIDDSQSRASSKLQNMLDLQVSGMNSKYDEEINFMIETFSGKGFTLSNKRNIILEVATKITQDEKFLQHLSVYGLPDTFFGSLLSGKNDLIITASFLFICTRFLQIPGCNASTRFTSFIKKDPSPLRCSVEYALEHHQVFNANSLSKMDRLALKDWLASLGEEEITPCYLSTVFLASLGRSPAGLDVLTDLCDYKLAELVMQTVSHFALKTDRNSFENQCLGASVKLFEAILDKVFKCWVTNAKDQTTLSKTISAVYDIIKTSEDTSLLEPCVTLAIVLTSNSDYVSAASINVHDSGLFLPLLQMIDRSGILLGSSFGTPEEHRLSLFSLGFLVNLAETEECIEQLRSQTSLHTQLTETYEKLTLEQDSSKIDKIHSIGYFCLLLAHLVGHGVLEKTQLDHSKLLKGLESFQNTIENSPGCESIKEQIKKSHELFEN